MSEEQKVQLRKEFNEKFCFITHLGNVTMKELDQEKYWEWFVSNIDEREKYIHNSIMVQWEKDYGSIHKEQTMDPYTVSGFIRSILNNTVKKKRLNIWGVERDDSIDLTKNAGRRDEM